MNKLELAWAAGFYEGEGSTGCYTKGLNRKGLPRHDQQLQLSVGQNNPEKLFKLRDIFGFGRIYGPYKTKRLNPITFYRTNRPDEVMTIMCSIWSWLSQQRKDQFKRAVLAWRTH